MISRRLMTALAVGSQVLVLASVLTGCSGGAAPTPPAAPPGNPPAKRLSKVEFEKTLTLTKGMSPDQAGVKLAKLAMEAFEADERELAKTAMTEASKRLGELTGDEPAATLVEVWSATAPAFYKVGQREEARANLTKAVAAVEKIETAQGRGLALSKLAVAQHGVGQTKEATAALKRAEELAAKEEDLVARLAILAAAASGEVSIGKPAEGDRIVQGMLTLAQGDVEPQNKALYLAMVGAAQASTDHRTEAAETFKQAKDTAESVKDPLKKAFAMYAVGQNMFGAKIKGGRDALEACRTFARNDPGLKNRQSEFTAMYAEIIRLLSQ